MTAESDGDRAARLAQLEASHGLDRDALKRILEQAVADHALLEELVEKHSCELPAWIELASELDARRQASLDAVDRVIRETMELDDRVFGAVSQADCLEILRALREEFERALNARAESAQLLATVAGTYREEGYAGSQVVDAAILRLVRELVDDRGLSPDQAADYAAWLAQLCGILSADVGDPRSELDARLRSAGPRFPDLTPLLPRHATSTFDEVANRVQQIALGLWPPEE